MRGVRALLVAVIVMGVMILVGTAVLISVVIKRAMHRTPVAVGAPAVIPQTAEITQQPSALALDQPPGTHILSVVRQSDTLLAITLAGGGSPDRLLVWDVAAGRVVARLTLDR